MVGGETFALLQHWQLLCCMENSEKKLGATLRVGA
jgi:hypothetical protein